MTCEELTSVATSSPLAPLRPILSFFHLIFGFPLTILDKNVTTFSFKNSAFWKCLFFPFAYVNASIIVIMLLVYTHIDASWQANVQRMQKYGLTATELTSLVFQFVPNGIGVIVIMYLYKRGAKALSRFVLAVTNYRSDSCIPGDFQHLAKKNFRWISIFYLFTLLAAVFSVIYYVQVLIKSSLNTMPLANLVLVSILAFVDVILVYFPFSVASAYLINLQLLGAIAILLHKFNGEVVYLIQHLHFIHLRRQSQLGKQHCTIRSPLRLSHSSLVTININEDGNEEFQSQSDEDTENMSDQCHRMEARLVTKGYRLISLVEMCERCLGPFIYFECALSMISQVFGAFFSTNIMMALQAKEFRPIQFCFGMTSFFATIQWVLRLHLLFNSGQHIHSEMSKIRKNLEVVLVTNCQSRSMQNHHRLGILIKKVGHPHPIRPMASFSLNRSAGLSVAGLLLTFMIVLLEFRLDGGGSAC